MKNLVSIHLQDPDEPDIDNAYRSLPRTGEIVLTTSFSGLNSQLEHLEQAGFAGLEIKAFGSPDEKMTIRALKGKQATCYDTGRFARYQGAALAALDDDHHLLIAGEEIPVCEKTATLYSLHLYRGVVYCSDAAKGMLEKLQTDPELFDCDNFEKLQEELFSRVRGKATTEEFMDLFYPGPFKLLVLADGTIVHRGRVNKVPVQETKKLRKTDGLFAFEGQVAQQHESFTDLYTVEGPRCLLKKARYDIVSEKDAVSDLPDPVPDLSVLPTLSRDLKNRMLGVIINQKDYFILTGSSREDKFGCCPSDEVTMADNLVRAGILDASREHTPADACPLTIYSFRNEMVSTPGDLQFNQDEDFRKEVYYHLKNKMPGFLRKSKAGSLKNNRQGYLINNRQGLVKIIARWVLLIFVAVTFLLAIIRSSGPSIPLLNRGLYAQLNVSGSNNTALVLFHYKKRCEQCLAMERYTREVLEDEFPVMMQNKQLQFKQVVMDLDENRSLIERFGLFTATLVIVRFEGRQEDSILVLDRSWALYNNEVEFKKMLSEELNQMTGQKNE